MTGNMIGKIFNNRYKITDRIGIGGMAEVYRAQDNVLGRVVAVKTMLPQYAADPTFTQRFRQEAAAAANLQSPYIVNVYDWGQDDGTYYIVMEFVRGSDLKTAIKERGTINQRKVAEIGSQVCQALNVAHNMDIIHRDIKPQNIMVQPDGNVKVMDFGIARAKNSVMTQTSSVLGTAHYISPEQAQGKELTPASDIYSLGIVLYEAATGTLPFDGPDAVSVALKQVNDYPVPPSEINPDIDPDLEAIIMKALEKQPQDRFDTANDMRLLLNDYIAGRPVYLNDTFGSAKTSVIAGGVAGAAVAGAGMENGTAVMPSAANGGPVKSVSTNYRANDESGAGRSRKKTIALALGIIVALALIGVAVFSCMNNAGEGDPVPTITGKTVEEATGILEEAGFKMGRQDTAYSDEIESGKIISQSPESGKNAEKGAIVNVTVSSGKEPVTVPDLTNKTVDEAKKILEELGLKASAGAGEHSTDIDVNHVIRTDPVANTQVHKGDMVTYYPSVGTEKSIVPDVRGKSRNDAVAALEAEGFKVSENDAYSEDVEAGYVISQNPDATLEVTKGTTVTIVISNGPEPTPTVDVPKVVGKSENDALSALQNAGLIVNTARDYSEKVASGNVISIDPSEGSTVDKGTTVTITISNGPEPTPEPDPTDDTDDDKKKTTSTSSSGTKTPAS